MDTIYNDILDVYFKENLLKNIQFVFNNKTLKEGKLISYKQDIYNVYFIMNTKKEDNDDFYLPIPFNIEYKDKNNIRFDYKLKTFCKNNEDLHGVLSDLTKKFEPSEYLDRCVDIKIL